MRIEQLSYLLVIKNCHSITQTGEILHISQQAISIAIKQLEDELGTLLLQRTSKGSYLTSAGEKVVDFATEFFDKWDVLTHEIMLENNTEEKTLFLYLQPDMQLDTFIPKIISILENNIPHLKLNIQYAHIENIVSFCQNEANAIGIYTISEEQYKNIPKCHQMILNTLYLTIWANHKSNILKSGTCSLASLKSQNIFSFFSESASENPIVDIIKNITSNKTIKFYIISPITFANNL